MPIEFECPECESTIRVKDSAAGKTGRCPKCRILLMVPDPSEWEDDDEDQYEDEPEAQENDPEPEPASIPGDASVHEPARQPESAPDSALDDATPAVVEPAAEPAEAQAPAQAAPPRPDTSEYAPDTVVSTFPDIQAEGEQAAKNPAPPSDVPPPAPTEVMDKPLAQDSAETFPPPDNPASAALSRVHARRRKKRMSTARRMSIAAAVGGMLLVLGAGWGLYWLSLPDLSGPLDGQRLPDVDLAEVTAPLPYDDVSEEIRDTVLADIGSNDLAIRTQFIQATIYAGDKELDVEIEPGSESVPVRVKLAGDPDIRAALKGVEKSINRAKHDELSHATAKMFEEYANSLKEDTPLKNQIEYRDKVALNAAVGTVGYAIEAVVRGTPFPCVYEDSEGYCYFFIPKGYDTFQIRGRRLFGDDEDAPLPVDFQVTLADHTEPVEASRTPPADTSEPTDKEFEAKTDQESDNASDQPEKRTPESGEAKDKQANDDKPAEETEQ